MLPLKEQWKFGRKLGKSILDHISILRPILFLSFVSLSPSTRPSIWGVSFCLRFFENLNSFKHSNTGNSVHCLSYPPNEPRIVKCGQEVEPGPGENHSGLHNRLVLRVDDDKYEFVSRIWKSDGWVEGAKELVELLSSLNNWRASLWRSQAGPTPTQRGAAEETRRFKMAALWGEG